jgi:hypothetical protein
VQSLDHPTKAEPTSGWAVIAIALGHADARGARVRRLERRCGARDVRDIRIGEQRCWDATFDWKVKKPSHRAKANR